MAHELVSLKRSQAEISKDKSLLASTEEDKFPFGTRLDFEKEEIDKIGISGSQVGKNFEVVAKATVIRVSKSADEDGDRENIVLQITDIAIEPASANAKDQAETLFGAE